MTLESDARFFGVSRYAMKQISPPSVPKTPSVSKPETPSLETEYKLPPIPKGHTRLTHFFESPESEKAYSKGSHFKYGVTATDTTDPFQSNEDVAKLIKTGKVGSFDRNKFGSKVLLMDVPHEEFKLHGSISESPGHIHGSRILGIVDRSTGKFSPHSGYDPTVEANYPKHQLTNYPGTKRAAPIQPIQPPLSSESGSDWIS